MKPPYRSRLQPRPASAGGSAQARYRALWVSGRRRRLVVRTVLVVLAGGIVGWLLGWQAGLATVAIAAVADMMYQRRHSPAAAWRKGAAGERATARLLRPLERNGYTVLHDRALPGRANVDHVIIGPGGVWVVDSKAWHPNTRISGHRGELWIGRRPAAGVLAAAGYEARTVGRLLSRGLGRHVDVVPIVAVHGARMPRWGAITVAGVVMMRARRVPRHIQRRPALYNATQVAELARAAARTLPPKTD